MAESNKNDIAKQKVTFRPKKRAKCLRNKRASSDSEEDKDEENMSTSKKNIKRPAEKSPEENPCKRNRSEEVLTICVICKDPDSQEPFTFLTCAHSFHTNCIIPWLARSSRCPICRTVVLENNEQSYERDPLENDWDSVSILTHWTLSDSDTSDFSDTDSFGSGTDFGETSSSLSSLSISPLSLSISPTSSLSISLPSSPSLPSSSSVSNLTSGDVTDTDSDESVIVERSISPF